jgi:hypothetical protein
MDFSPEFFFHSLTVIIMEIPYKNAVHKTHLQAFFPQTVAKTLFFSFYQKNRV